MVILPKKLSKALGGIGPIILVYKVTTHVHIVDVHTMQTHTIDSIKYWNYMFKAVASRERLTEFIVLNIEETDMEVNVSRAAAKKKYKMVTCEIARQEDFGSNDRTFFVNTFLGNVINPFDTVLGYDLD